MTPFRSNEKGYLAHGKGTLRTSNPYRDPYEKQQWFTGWDEADKWTRHVIDREGRLMLRDINKEIAS